MSLDVKLPHCSGPQPQYSSVTSYADPTRRLAIGFAKNYFAYLSGNALNAGRPPRAPSNVVAEAVFDALELPR